MRTIHLAQLSLRRPCNENKTRLRTKPERKFEGLHMIRLARDAMALASVGSFVWMVCTAAQLVG